MRRALAALLIVIALAILATLDPRSVGRVSAAWRHAAAARFSKPHTLTSLRQLEASGFLTRHALVEKYRSRAENDTSEVGYWLTNHRLRTRQTLVLTVVGGDSVVRAELGFASAVFAGDCGQAIRTLLTDFLGTFVPPADSAHVSLLRAQIEANTDPGSLATAAYLPLLGRRDSVAVQYKESRARSFRRRIHRCRVSRRTGSMRSRTG